MLSYQGEEMLVAEVFVRPETNAIVPPFSSKVGKTLLSSPKSVSISPLKRNQKYLVKYSDSPAYLEVFGGEIYSFEVGGEREQVVNALTHLDEKRVFNTLWRVEDVKMCEVKVDNLPRSFEIEILTPALIVSPFLKLKRKVFTNKAEYVLFTNLIDVTGLKRGDERLIDLLSLLSSLLWEEPSIMRYAKVNYAGKTVIGIVGKLRYSIIKEHEIIKRVLESAIAKGIGSSRRNGFGRVKVLLNGSANCSI